MPRRCATADINSTLARSVITSQSQRQVSSPWNARGRVGSASQHRRDGLGKEPMSSGQAVKALPGG
ncbi:hypothetical protein MFU01_06200 [Myxococcus fulvus]|uniref:Uncharacterized protein n=1 Tax=Myxococcus fulvus TaxID=33 RepID=A0A511SW84_MYXFU|nr:hypothetical protein MFU01_06200 [Myxococcus fulvus]